MPDDLPALSGREVVSAFEKAGFNVVRIRGSHHVMKKDAHRYVLTVPVHGGREVRKGTLRTLIRDAGLTREQFLELL